MCVVFQRLLKQVKTRRFVCSLGFVTYVKESETLGDVAGFVQWESYETQFGIRVGV